MRNRKKGIRNEKQKNKKLGSNRLIGIALSYSSFHIPHFLFTYKRHPRFSGLLSRDNFKHIINIMLNQLIALVG